MAPRKKPKPSPTSSAFLEALKFVGTVLKESGTVNETHCLINNGYLIAANGVVAAGIKVIDDREIIAAPNYSLLIAALAKASEPEIEPSNINDSDVNWARNLIIKSNKFKAIVPCIDPILISLNNIDPPIAKLTNDFKTALETVGVLANENGQNIYSCSVLMAGASCIATEGGRMVLEAWHGCDCPPGLALPKAFISALAKVPKDLKAFGFSPSSITVYFEDDSFLKTQLFSEQWPDIGEILNKPSNMMPIPKDLWEGMNAVCPHSTDGLVYFDHDVLRSHNNEGVGASYEVKGLPRGPIFNIKQLMLIKDLAKEIDFFAVGKHGTATMFRGDKCRGAIAGRTGQ